jgi:hypothetical protein
MRRTALLVFGLVLVVFIGRVHADPDESGEHGDHEAPAAEHHDDQAGEAHEGHEANTPEPVEHDGSSEHGEHDEHAVAAHDEHEDDIPADEEPPANGDEPEDEQQMDDSGVDPDEAAEEAEELKEEGSPPFNEYDEDGDGVVTAEEKADEAELKKDFKGIPTHIDTEKTDAELDERAKEGKALLPSVSVEQFRAGVHAVKKIVLARMEKKMAAASAKKMAKFSKGVFVISLLGVLLLAIPLVVGKRYPGKGGVLFKYSALAAGTFFVTVNLFGGVLMVMRSVQGALSGYTNPQVAIVSATFDTLDKNAEEYAVMGKELFMPTMEALRGNTDEQPVVLLMENGQKIVKDAKVFLSVAKMLKKVDFIFEILPIVLMLVTMVLFVLAIKPTLIEIVKLPIRVASGEATGNAGREVVGNALRRIKAEALAALCTLGVLAVLTIVSSLVLGEIVSPAIDSLLRYFCLCITYLQFADGASSGTVFMTLFGVIFFLVLNLAVLILSMSFFIGKCQKIFQAKFQRGVAIETHKPWLKWAVGAVLLVQVFPWLFALIADKLIGALDSGARSGVTDPNAISWGKTLLAGPLILVAGFLLLFWAAQGVRAIRFLFSYKVK